MNATPVQDSKRTFRKRLASLSVVEKLRMLDALRERVLAIRRASKSDATIEAETAPGTAKRLIKENSELLKLLR